MPSTLTRPRVTAARLVDLLAGACGLLDDALANCVSDARVSGPLAEAFAVWRAEVAAALSCDEADLSGGTGDE